jgi:hypothetical protein
LDVPEFSAVRPKFCHTQDSFFDFFVRLPLVEIFRVARGIRVTGGTESPPGKSNWGLDPMCSVDPDIDGNVVGLARKSKA